jgi:hypothetical protein
VLNVAVPANVASSQPASQPASQPNKLRVGVLAGARAQPRWLVDAFAKVAASDFAEIVLLAVVSPEIRSSKKSAPGLQRLYASVDRLAFGADPSQPADLGAQVAHGRFIERPTQAQLVELDLDVLFALGEVDDRDFDGVARHGIWRFCFGPERTDPEALAGYREVAEDAPVTGSGIKVRLAAGATPRLAYQSWSRTYPLSVARNRDRMLRKTSEFAWRALRELQRSGAGWLEQCPPVKENRGQAPISPKSPKAKSPKAILPFAFATENRSLTPIFNIGRKILQRGAEKALNVEQWFLAYRFRETRFGDARAIAPTLAGYTRIIPPKDRTWADPFPLEKDGRYFVFFEELPFATNKAHISMIELKRDGSYSAPVRVLERDYHLSYPFLIEQDGELLMIPETAQNGTVEVYRCIDFPLRWKRERVLLEGVSCVDATFHRGTDRWWMFANAAPSSRGEAGGMFDDELHLFHADSLLGDWQPHRRNPVKSDARCARPAGNLYWHRGALYRPAQICVPLYGAGLSINRVLRLTPHDYAERQVERILPGRASGVLGLHTVNRAGDLTVIDAFARRRRF